MPVSKLANGYSAGKLKYFLTRRLALIGFLLLIPFHTIYSQWLTGFQHRKVITIPAAQISGGPHTDFPVLVSTTDPDLRSQANGGYIVNSSAWDIAFSIDNVTTLDHQVESFNPVTGQITVWVRIPTLTGGSNFVFYIYFGNAGISSDPSTTSTWSSDYNGVWHLSGLSDATNYALTATNNGTTGTTGIIDDARDFPGTGQYLQISQATIHGGDFTISTWFKPDNAADGTIFDLSNAGSSKFFFSSFNSTALSWDFEAENETDALNVYNITLNTSKWYYLTVIGRFNDTYQDLYLDGNLVGSTTILMDNKPVLNDIRIGSDWGYYPIINHGPFNGSIDEFRISKVDRTPGWILTEYHNQYAPASFMSFGSREDGVPQVFNLSGSGAFCSGTGGRPIQLSGSQAGVEYQLKNNGNDVGPAVAGTGGILNWTGSNTGVYTVVATNISSGLSASMNGSATLTENVTAAAVLGYKFQKTITIDHTKVIGGSNLIDFPVLINIAGGSAESNEIRTIANGGNVENINGYDIIFTDASYNKLDHQIERYDPVTGNLVAWVRVPVLSSTINTSILMLYGNPQSISNQSVSTVWNSNFRGVWHLNGTDFTDASQYTNDGINSGSVDIAGQIGYAKRFNGSTDFINAGNDPSLFVKSAITVSAWVNANNPTNGHIINMGGGWSDPGYSLFWYSTNIRVELQPVKTINDVPAPSFGAWHYVAFTWDNSTKQIQTYIDGAPTGAGTSYDGPIGDPLQNLLIGKNANQAGYVFNGIIDEARVQSIARSSGWITTEYNNQKTANTFYSIGSQTGCSVYSFSGICSGSPVTYSVPNTSGHTYTWTVVGGSPSATTGNSISVTWNAGGPYSIQLSESNGTCVGNSLNYSVVVNPPPVGPTLNVKTPNLATVCDGQSVSATFTAGSGGVGCSDAYQYRYDSGTWNSYTPGSNLNTAGHVLVEIQGQRAGCTAGAGCTGTVWVTLATWTVSPQPVGPALNAKTPNLATVCDGQAVSATFTAGSGGVGCSDVFQYRYDSGTWTSYTPGNSINTSGHILVEIQGQRAGCTAGAGCTGTAWVTLASWTVNPQPVGPTLNAKTPNLATVCDGQAVSATFTAGSGGVGCSDVYQYRYDSGTWNSYTPGNNINTTGHGLIEIQGQRAGCTAGTGCTGTAWVTLASWTVNPQPVGPTLNAKTPNLATVCDGQAVSATFTAGSGGVGCSDVFQYRYDSGTWTSYTPGNSINTSGHILVEIQGQRAGCTAGVGCTGTAWVTLASWTINPQPVGPTLNAKTPNLATVCDGQSVSATFTAGSGGVGCSDVFQYRYDSGTWTSYTPGNSINTSGHILVEIQGQRAGCTAGTGCTGTAWVTLASWTINPQPVGPTLNAKTPNLSTVCDGQAVSATFTAGSGGVGCNDVFQYRYDSGTWNSYTPGNSINTTGHGLIEIQGQRAGCTAGAGCTGTAWVTLASWTVNPQPVGPTLNAKTPNLATVCDGQAVSATFTAGSGGVGCSDAFQYRYDSGTWNSYTPGSNLNTAGHVLVEIQGQRAGCTAGTGCTGTAWVTLASWTVNPQPVGPTLNAKTPNLSTVCDGQAVSATFTAGSGGVGCSDVFQYRYDSGTWTSYTPGNSINTTGHLLIEIQGQRTGCTAGAGCTGTAWVTLASWTINPQPVGPTLNAKTPNLTTVCDGQAVSATFTAGSGGVGCSDAFQYRYDSGTWNSYTPGSNLNTAGHVLVEIQGQRAGCTAGTGCTGTAWVTLASWTVNPQPVGPTLNSKTPNLSTVCDGQAVSATFTAGSGGVGCSDVFQYRYDSGTWNSYTPGNSINTAGHLLIEIQGQRTGCTSGAGCTGTAWVTLASWTVNPQPVGPTLNAKIPNLASICDGLTVSATFTAGSGGLGCTDAYQYRFDSGTWNSYTPGTNLNTAGHVLVEIQGQRAGCTAGAGCTGTAWVTLASWIINPNPSPVITGPSNVCPGSNGVIYSTPLIAGNNYTWTVTGASSYSGENTNILTVNWPNTCGTGSVKVTETVSGTGCSTSTSDYTVSRTDLIAPVWSTAAASLNRTVQCSDAAGLSAAQALFPLASDNCDTDVSDIVKIAGGFIVGSCPQAGTYTNTWTVTDACGNISSVFTQVITIVDTQKPVWTNAVNTLDRTVQCSDVSGLAAAQSLQPSASDNCDTDVSNIIKISGTFVPGGNPREGTYTNTWTVTDDCGNVSLPFTQTITIIDNSAPVITCPADVTISCEDDSTPSGTGVATAADNCSPLANINIGHSDVSTFSSDPSSVLHYNYSIVRTWRATDEAGNFSECTQTITVHDITKPAITCPADVTINCQDDNTPAGTGIATATDNCTPVANISITHSDLSTQIADPSDPLHYNYSIVRTWRATDVVGNYNECSQNITVHDISPPVITCPTDKTISCDGDRSPAATGTPVYTDNCTPLASITLTFTDVSTQSSDPSNLLHYNYTITRTWKAKDVTGNYSECVQMITVHDITNPVISCPGNVILNCEEDNTPAGTGTATATDICTPVANLSITHSDLSTYNADPSNVLHYNYSIQRTWRATDVAGNFSECIQTITVHDVTAPVISCPANVTLNCEDDNTPATTGTASATDICTPAVNISVTHSDLSTYDSDPSKVLHYNYSIIRTWRATDVAGNYSECSQTITVHDITKPVITCPADVTINCQDDNTPSGTGTATATDICTPVGNLLITHSDVSTQSSDPSDPLHYNYSIVRTWRATDVAGNYNECSQNITVHDISNPVITCPSDKTINCEDDNTPAGTGSATATDSCSPLSNITITFSDVSTQSSDPSDILHYNYTITRTWNAKDIAGNFSECTQLITVHDVTKPTFTVPATITVCRASDCTYDAGIAVTGDVTDESDNCTPGNLLNAVYTDDLSGLIDCDNYGFILRTWTLTDITGNTTVKVQTIWIEPTPSVSIINNSPVVCDGNNVNLVFSSPTSSVHPNDLKYEVTVTSTDPTHLGGSASEDFTILKAGLPYTFTGSLTNSSDAPITVTYTVVPQLNNCSNGPVQTTTVIVDPTPQVLPDKLSQTICNDGTTSITLASPSIFNSGVITFSYTVTATGGVTGFITPVSGLPKDYLLSDVLHNPTDSPQTVTYTIVPVSPAGCPSGPSKNIVITVEPTPKVVPLPITQTICNNETTNIILGSPSTFVSGSVTFNYTVSATGGVTGFTTPTTGLPRDHVIADVLINPTDAPQTVTYTITPVSPSGCSDGPVSIVTVIVNPTPQVNPGSMTQVVCNDGTTSITLASPSSFSSGAITFNFTAVATGGITGFTASGTGVPADFIISDVLHNPTDAPQTVTYTIVPLSPTGCQAGPSKAVVVSVDPTPQVVPSALTQKICNDGTTSIVLYSPSTFTNGVITFNYTVVATGGVTGFASPTTGLQNNFTLSDLLHNPTNDPQTVTYTIEPVSPSGCASGPTKTVVITVEPTPSVTPGPLTQTICNDATANILLTSPSTFTNGVITFNYTVVATGGVTGFTTPVVNLPNNYTISDVLHNPSDAPQTVTYTIVPISPECSATDPVKVVIVIVEPTPQVVPNVLNQSICNGGTTNIILGSPSTFTSGLITFNFTATATGGVTGFTPSGTGLPKDYLISDVLINPTDAPQTVTYKITPVSPTGCPNGPDKTVVVTVNPTPQVIPSTLAETICNDAPVNVTLSSPSTFDSGLITFNYTVSATGGVSGFTSPVVGLPKDYLINDILHNPTDSPQTVTYTIVPVSPSGCPAGPSKILVITVNPTPQVVPGTLAQTICNDGATNIILASPSIFTTGVITFNYTVVATGGVTGFTSPQTGLPKDYVIADILHNPTDSPQTVTYTVTPQSPTGCPPGQSKVIVVTVDPTPQVVPGTLAQTICNDSPTSIPLGSPSTFKSGVITFKYTVTATGGVTGFSTPVTGLAKDHIITDLLHNPTDIPQTVTYTIVPVSPAGCADGPSKTVIVTVNPTPQVVPNTLSQTICNDGTTNLVLGSPSIFTSGVIKFNYTVTATGGVTGFTTPVNNLPKDFVIADVLHNPTDAPQTVTYTIVPVSPAGCPGGVSKVIVVTVNPTPQVVPGTLLKTICNDGSVNVTLGSPSTFSSGVITFNYTVVATGGVTGFTTPVNGLPKDFVISDILHNPSDAPQTVTYTIVPVSPTGCPVGPVKILVITINPTPQVVPSVLSQTICNDGTTNVILGSPSTFSNGVIRFNYTVVATGGVTGFTTPVTGLPKDHVIADVLHNPTDGPQTVTYNIVPVSPAGCASGPAKIVIITVNPTPRIFPVPANTIQCDSITTSIRLQSPSTFSNGLITFNYTVTSTGFVTGFSSPVNGLPNNQIIADKLINSSNDFQVVTYTITPISPSGCAAGIPKSVTVTVNPTPKAELSNVFPSICYAGTSNAPVTTDIVLGSRTRMTSGSIVFDYTVSTTGSGAIVGNTTPGVNRPRNYTISYSYQNNSDTIQSVYYRITPKVDNSICPPGKTVISEVKIHAKPLQSIVVTKPLTCSEGAGLAELKAVISKGADPYHLDWKGSFGYHKVDSLLISNLSSGKYILNVTDNLGCNNKDSVSILPVTAQATIQAAIIPPGNYNLSCVGSTDGTILVSVAGGITPPYTYSVIKNDVDVLYTGVFTGNLNLTDPSTFRYLNNLGAGSYTLIIRDVNMCENLNRIVLRVPPPISASIKTTSFAGGFNISCKGYNDGSAWVVQPVTGGRGTYSYRWYTFNGVIPGPINTDRIDNLVAGTYYLEIKDILGCTQVQSTVITEPDGMQLASYQLSKSPDGNFNISCNGGIDGSISMSVTGGSGNYIYTWTGPNGFTSTTKDITGLKAGIYTCSVRDLNGCVLIPSPSFTLTEPTPLAISAATYSTSADGAYNISCFGANTGWVHISVSGGSTGSYSYNWTTSNGSGIVAGQKDQNALSAGNYHLVVTDLNNCSVIKDITLTQAPEFIIQLAPTNITCKSPGFNNGSINLTVNGGIAPYSYLWSNGAVSEDLTNLTPGNYTVTVTDANGCIKTGTATIELPPALNYTKSLSDYNGFNISCNGLSNGFIHVDPTTGSAPFVYSWTGPDGFASPSKNINDIKSGQYILQITDNNECKASEIFNLTEPGKLAITYTLSQSTAGGYNVNCAGDSTGFITVTPVNQVNTVSYLWQDGIFGKSRSNLPAGSYNLIITDANNCHASETINLTEPDSLKIIFNITPPFCPDKPDGKIETSISGGVSGAGYRYIWSDNSTASNLTDIPEGKFELVVTDLNGCSAKKSEEVVAMNETCLVIPNAITPNGDLINDVWNIGMKELYPSMEVKIFNRWGQSIWRSEKGYPRPWDGTSNGSTLPMDSYHYIIDLHNGSKPLVGNVTIVR